jgi:hypothetical protein
MSRPIVEVDTSSQPAIRVIAPRSNPSSSTSNATRLRRWATARVLAGTDAGAGFVRIHGDVRTRVAPGPPFALVDRSGRRRIEGAGKTDRGTTLTPRTCPAGVFANMYAGEADWSDDVNPFLTIAEALEHGEIALRGHRRDLAASHCRDLPRFVPHTSS